jgi:hypothetical protein
MMQALVVIIGTTLALAFSALGLAWAGFWVAYGIQLAGGIQ